MLSPEEELLPLSHRLLHARGVTNREDVLAFLNPDLNEWHDPALFPDMEIACERISRAISQKETILIYGDYDADGITATALLTLFLEKTGAACSYIIPDRASEGYGMSELLFAKIFERKPDLLITVDCGVANIEEVAAITRAGIDVIITDHHEVKPVLPSACAVLNAKRSDSRYPFSQLSGVGVALKLVQALCVVLSPMTRKDDWRAYLDLAVIGTIADLVPVLDENRVLVREGMAVLAKMERPGIRALFEASLQKDPRITSTTVGFVFVPRINAAGRMGDAARAVELMMTQDYDEAQSIAEELSRENTRRQEIELSIYEDAVRILENPGDGTNVVHAVTGPILVRGKDWHPGVIGIVASRLVSRYHRAAIVFTENSGQEGMIKGSARACEGYNILEAILYAQEFTDQFGGHPKAAGISVSATKYDAFANRIREYEQQNEDEPCVPTIIVDGLLTAADLTLDTCREVAFLGPFGEGNREPRFAVRGCRIIRTEICGKGKHLKIRFAISDDAKQESVFDAIAFGLAEHDILYQPESQVNVVVSMSISTWGNRESMSLQIVDIHFARSGRMIEDAPDILEKLYENDLPFKQMAVLSKESVDTLLPDKESVKAVYQFLRTYCTDDISLCDASLLARYVSAHYSMTLHGFALLRILDIFEEAGLLRIYSRKGQRICFTLIFVEGKVKLENTKTYQRLFIEGGSVS